MSSAPISPLSNGRLLVSAESINAASMPALKSAKKEEEHKERFLGIDQELSLKATERREKIKNHLIPILPNPKTDPAVLGFFPPVLSFSCIDICSYLTPRLKEILVIQEPFFIGGVVSHILFSDFTFADADIGFDVKYLAISEINSVVSEFILLQLIKEKKLDLGKFIFNYLLKILQERTKTDIYSLLKQMICPLLAEWTSIPIDFYRESFEAALEKFSKEGHGHHSSFFALDSIVRWIKDTKNIDLLPCIMDCLMKAKFKDRDSEEETLELRSLVFDFLESTYLYKRREIKTAIGAVVGLVIDLGGIDLKFINANAVDYRAFVGLNDSLRVPLSDTHIECTSGSFQETIKAMIYRKLVIPEPKKVSDLVFRISLNAVRGFELLLPSETLEFALDQLKMIFPVSSKSKSELHPLTLRFQRHQSSHYPCDEIGQLVDFINFIFLLSHLKKGQEKQAYMSLIAHACQKGSLSQSFAILVLNDFENALSLLNVVWGVLLTEWIRKNPRIQAYKFFLEDDQGQVHERISMHIALRHAKGTHYFALPFQSPDKLMKEFLSSWRHLQEVLAKSGKKDLSGSLNNIFKAIGVENFDFYSADSKRSVVKLLFSSFEEQSLSKIISERFFNTLNPAEKISPVAFYEFLEKEYSEDIEWIKLEERIVVSKLKRLREDLQGINLEIFKDLSVFLTEKIFVFDFQVTLDDLNIFSKKLEVVNFKELGLGLVPRNLFIRSLYLLCHKLILGRVSSDVLNEYMKIIVTFDPELAKKILKLDDYAGQLKKEDLVEHTLSIDLHEMERCDHLNVHKLWEKWQSRQDPKCDPLFIENVPIFLIKLQIATCFLSVFFTRSQKESSEKILILGKYILQLLQRSKKHLNVESINHNQQSSFSKTIEEVFHLFSSEKARLEELQNLEALCNEMIHFPIFLDKAISEMTFARMIMRYIQLNMLPPQGIIKVSSELFFNPWCSDRCSVLNETIIQVTTDFAKHLMKQKQDRLYDVAFDLLLKMLVSKLLEVVWKPQVGALCVHLITEMPKNLRPLRKTDESFSQMVGILAKKKTLKQIKTRCEFLQTLMDIGNEGLFSSCLNKMAPFHKDELQLLCTYACKSKNPLFINLIYNEFKKLGIIDQGSCRIILEANFEMNEVSFFNEIQSDSFFLKGIALESLSIKEKIKYYLSLFKYVDSINQLAQLDKEVRLKHAQFLEIEWQNLIKLKLPESVKQAVCDIRNSMFRVFANVKDARYLLQICKIFREEQTDDNHKCFIAKMILEGFLNLQFDQYALPEVLGELKRVSVFIAEKRIINAKGPHVLEIFGQIQESLSRLCLVDKSKYNQNAMVQLIANYTVLGNCFNTVYDPKNLNYKITSMTKAVQANLINTVKLLMPLCHQMGRYQALLFLDALVQAYVEKEMLASYHQATLDLFEMHTEYLLKLLSMPYEESEKSIVPFLETTIQLIPLLNARDISHSVYILKIAHTVLKHRPNLCIEVNKLLEAADHNKIFPGSALPGRLELEVDLLETLCFSKIEKIEKEAPELIQKSFNFFDQLISMIEFQKQISLEMRMIKMLTNFQINYPNPLKLAIRRLDKLAKIADLRDLEFYLCISKVTENLVLHVVSTPNAEKTSEYQQYLLFINYLANGMSRPEGKSDFLALNLLEAIFSILIDQPIFIVNFKEKKSPSIITNQAVFKKRFDSFFMLSSVLKLMPTDLIKKGEVPSKDSTKKTDVGAENEMDSGTFNLLYTCHNPEFLKTSKEEILERAWRLITSCLCVCHQSQSFVKKASSLKSGSTKHEIEQILNIFQRIKKGLYFLEGGNLKFFSNLIIEFELSWERCATSVLSLEQELLKSKRGKSESSDKELEERQAAIEELLKLIESDDDFKPMSEADLFDVMATAIPDPSKKTDLA
jgi:hypothetical protein